MKEDDSKGRGQKLLEGEKQSHVIINVLICSR